MTQGVTMTPCANYMPTMVSDRCAHCGGALFAHNPEAFMYENEEGDKELLERLIQLIVGDKMIGIEAAAVAMKQDAEKWRSIAEGWKPMPPQLTDEMRSAAQQRFIRADSDQLGAIYAGFFSAAPPPDAAKEGK